MFRYPDAKSLASDPAVFLLTSTQVVADPFVLEETAQGKKLWRQQHSALFADFSCGTHQCFATGHNIHREDPKAVADAIIARSLYAFRAKAPASIVRSQLRRHCEGKDNQNSSTRKLFRHVQGGRYELIDGGRQA